MLTNTFYTGDWRTTSYLTSLTQAEIEEWKNSSCGPWETPSFSAVGAPQTRSVDADLYYSQEEEVFSDPEIFEWAETAFQEWGETSFSIIDPPEDFFSGVSISFDVPSSSTSQEAFNQTSAGEAFSSMPKSTRKTQRLIKPSKEFPIFQDNIFPTEPYPSLPIISQPHKTCKSITRCDAIRRLLSAQLPASKPKWVIDSDWSALLQYENLVKPIMFKDNTIILAVNRLFDIVLHDYLNYGVQTTDDKSEKRGQITKNTRFRWWSDTKELSPELEIKNYIIDTSTIGRKIKLPPRLHNNKYLHHLATQNSLDVLCGEINLFFHNIVKTFENSHQNKTITSIKLLVEGVETLFLSKWEAGMNKVKPQYKGFIV
jgi:hypothetical protein